MYQDPYLTHRVIALEAERATRLLEQRRMIAENGGRIVRRPGLLARLARAAASQRQAVAEPACPAGSRCAVADA
jgi:hypothetical protein